MTKYLLREYYQLCDNGVCQDFLTEEEKRLVKEENAMFLTGIAQRADHHNGNGRFYPYKTLTREVENYKKLVETRRSIGECDHPDSTVISLGNASHMVTDIWWEDKDVMVKLKVLSGAPGQQLRSLVNDGVSIGLSSRGLGSVTETKGGLMVEDDFQLICFDVVSEPSTQGAFMNLMEAKLTGKHEILDNKTYKINRILNDILGE